MQNGIETLGSLCTECGLPVIRFKLFIRDVISMRVMTAE